MKAKTVAKQNVHTWQHDLFYTIRSITVPNVLTYSLSVMVYSEL